MAFLFYIVFIALILLVAIATTKVKIDIINLKYARATPKNVFGKKSKSRKNIEFLIKIKVYISKTSYNIIENRQRQNAKNRKEEKDTKIREKAASEI